jgi:tetratricopeptide (TPR) repeat protein
MTPAIFRSSLISAVAAGALATWLSVATLSPAHADEADNLYRQGLAFKKEGRTDEAIAAIYKAVQLRQTHTAARISLGWLYLKKGNFAQAAEAFEVATKYAKGNRSRQQAYSGLGTTHARLNRWVEAEKALKVAYDIEPNDPDVNQNLGFVYRQLHQYDKAVLHTTIALNSRPNDPVLMSNLSVALRWSGNFGDAEALLKRLLAQNPNDGLAHFNIAVLYRRTKRNDLAIKHYLEAIRLKPTFPDPHLDLGVVYNHERRNKEAIAELKTFLSMTGGKGPDAFEAKRILKELKALDEDR